METNEMMPADILGIVQRRKWSIVLPCVVVVLIAGLFALFLPPVYKSTSTILIEEQEIPQDFVMTTVTSYAEQRLQMINQRIMSSAKLLEIMNQFSLYPELQETWTTEEILEKMAEDINFAMINADIMDRRTGRPATATIAFTLSYEGEDDPNKVQRVANHLASLFLEENLKTRERQATETFSFLEEEARKMKEGLTKIDEQITLFKSQNYNIMPNMMQSNIQTLHTIDLNVERLQEKLNSLKQRQGDLELQMAGIMPELAGAQDKQRLDQLKAELAYLQSRFSDEYPDVINAKADIAKLEKQIKESAASDMGSPDNPSYIALASQLSGTKTEMESIQRQLEKLVPQREEYQKMIAASAQIEEPYNAMLLERASMQAKYNELLNKVMEAKVSQGLEKEQKGGRFTLIDPARLPEKPYKPNRLAIMLIGIVLGIGAGVGFAALREFSDQSIRGAESLAQLTSFPVLGVIPEIVTEGDFIRKRRKQILTIVSIVLAIAAAIAIFHFLVMDLDVFWAKVMRRAAKI